MSYLISVAGSADSRAEILMLNNAQWGGAFHCWQTSEGANSSWAAWEQVVPASDLSMAVSSLDGAGRLALAWLNAGVIWVAAATVAGGGLQPARQLDTQNLRNLTLTTNKDGRLEFLALDNNGVLWSVAQSTEGSWDNLNIHFLDGNGLQQIALTPYGDGRLTVVALGADAEVFRIEQQGAGNNWGGWIDIGGHDIKGVSACPNADGRLEIVAVGSDGAIYDYFERPDGSWSTWEFITAGAFVGAPLLVRNQDGRLEVFAQAADTGLHHTYQQKAGQAWVHSTVPIEVLQPIDSFSVARMNDGRLALVVGYQLCYCTFLSQATKNALTFSQLAQQPGTACAPPPSIEIVKFQANPDYINFGQSSSLEYQIQSENCNPLQFGLTAQVSGGPVMSIYTPGASIPAGVITVSPTKDTKYTLSVKCLQDGASAQKSAEITIAPIQMPQAVVAFSNGPFLTPEFPEADQSFTAVVYATNFGNTASTEFDIIFQIDQVNSSSAHQSPLAPGQTATIKSNVSGLSAGFHDLDWNIPQYGKSLGVTIST